MYVFCGCIRFVSTPSTLGYITAKSVSKQGQCTSRSGAGEHRVLEIRISCGYSSLLICKHQSCSRLLWKWCNLPKESWHCHASAQTQQEERHVSVWAYLWFLDFCRIGTLSATVAPSTLPVPARGETSRSVNAIHTQTRTNTLKLEDALNRFLLSFCCGCLKPTQIWLRKLCSSYTKERVRLRHKHLCCISSKNELINILHDSIWK